MTTLHGGPAGPVPALKDRVSQRVTAARDRLTGTPAPPRFGSFVTNSYGTRPR